MSGEITIAEDGNERRDFFRIDDSVSMSYQVVMQEELPSRIEDVEVEDNFTVMAGIASINQNMAGIMHRIEEDDHDVATYLKSINAKIDILGRAMLLNDNDLIEQPAQPVNLSASGLAFYTAENIDTGVILELRLMFMSSFTGMITFGEVVKCDKADEPVGGYDYLTRVNFMHMREKDRDLLIRHVIKCQSDALRRRREQNEQLDGS